MKELRSVAPDQRPAMGKIINELKPGSRPSMTPLPTR